MSWVEAESNVWERRLIFYFIFRARRHDPNPRAACLPSPAVLFFARGDDDTSLSVNPLRGRDTRRVPGVEQQ